MLPRLVAFVLACALLLLPLAGIAEHLDTGDWQGQKTGIDAASPVLVLSNHDTAQVALRNAEAKHSGKTAGGAGKATFGFLARLPEPQLGRLVSRIPHDAGLPQQSFLAFSARAPPRQV
ncbi:hypothetical protein [Mesorhizobium sp. ANAO-SY3R2]|uniref:hypothetical protein n=1 Tax=Mesorhizobium sp. ANAO-SY3R2 TaxID=3166644 RepID=UPI00366FC443